MINKFFLSTILIAGSFLAGPIVKAVDDNIAAVASQEEGEGKNLVFSLNLVWEGDFITDENIKAIRLYREKYPNIRINHFISAAYFLKKGSDPVQIKKNMDLVMKDGDNYGLALYSWKSVVGNAGAIFRGTPTFWGHSSDERVCKIDCGRNIPITIFSEDELVKIIIYSKDILSQYGIGDLKSLIGGGWMSGENVHNAAKRTGIEFDFSKIPSYVVSEKLRGYPLLRWLKDEWNQGPFNDQPHMQNTRHGKIMLIPNNLGALDYMSQEKIMAMISMSAERMIQEKEESRVVSLTFFQETAVKYSKRLSKLTDSIYNLAARKKIKIVGLKLDRGDLRFVERTYTSPAEAKLADPNYFRETSTTRFSSH